MGVRDSTTTIGRNTMPIPKRTVELVYSRAGYACERCGTNESRFWSIHHRRPRGMGGTKRSDTNTASNLILVCGSGTTGCHGWIESNRAEALGLGLLVHQFISPLGAPVTLTVGRVLLDDDGGWQPC